MDNIDSIFEKLEKSMQKLSTLRGNGFSLRTIQPSPGDTFDIHYNDEYTERFTYVSNEYIIPLYRVDNGEIVEYHGYKSYGIDIMSWDELLESVELDGGDNARLEIVSTLAGHKTPLDSAIDKVSEWAMRNPDQRESILLMNVVEKLRGN